MRRPLALAVALPLILAPVAASPASAQAIVDQKKMQRLIKADLKEEGYRQITVNCPANIVWRKGKSFTCRITTAEGQGRVQVTMTSKAGKGRVVWKPLP